MITPQGIIVVNGQVKDCSSKRMMESQGKGLDILHYNSFFKKFLKINDVSSLCELLQVLPISNYTQPDREDEFLGNSIMEVSSLENVHELLLKKIMRFSQQNFNIEMNYHELKIAEFSSFVTYQSRGGVRTEINFEISLFDFRWEDQPCILIILQDVSEKKKNEKLIVLDKYKDMLMASVSHELKTPLNSIIVNKTRLFIAF